MRVELTWKRFLDDNKLNRGLKLMEARLKKAGAALTRVGGQLALGGGLAIAPATAQFVAFDDAMRLVRATGELTGAEMERIAAHARELGRSTAFSATEVANLMVELARAGFAKPEVLENMTGAVIDLARATGTDATLSAEVMAATLKQFGLQAGDASRVADGLAKTANSTFNSVTDLAYALKYSGEVAAKLNLSLEDTLALLGGLGEVNIRGEMGGTTLRRLLTLTASEAAEFQKVFGVAAKDAAGNARPLVDVMEEMWASLEGLGTADVNAKLNEFFGILGLTGSVVVGSGAKGIRTIREEIGLAGGYAKRTAKEMDAGLGGSFRRLRGSVVDSAIAIGGALAPALEFVAVVFKGVANDVSEWVGKNREAAAAIGVAVVSLTALGGVLFIAGIAFKALGIAVGVVATAFTLATTAIGFLLTPVGLVSAAIAGLSVMLIEGEGWRQFTETAREAFGGIVAALQKGDIGLAWEIVCAGLNLEWQKVMMFWRAGVEDFTAFFRNQWEDLTDWLAAHGPLAAESWFSSAKIAAAALFGPGSVMREAEEAEKRIAAAREVGLAVREDAEREEKARLERQARERAAALKPFEDAIAKAEARLRELVGKAKAGLPVAPMPHELNVAPMPRAVGARAGGLAAGIAESVRGAFAVPNARLMFGQGTGFERRHLNAAEKTAKATAATEKLTEKLILALAFK